MNFHVYSDKELCEGSNCASLGAFIERWTVAGTFDVVVGEKPFACRGTDELH